MVMVVDQSEEASSTGKKKTKKGKKVKIAGKAAQEGGGVYGSRPLTLRPARPTSAWICAREARRITTTATSHVSSSARART